MLGLLIVCRFDNDAVAILQGFAEQGGEDLIEGLALEMVKTNFAHNVF